ncbi:carbohydrate ABC transporter substrate-binding protein [Planosporangium thailandense]|uniref:Carbohydrate ABC transporter substrate-binding protein n=1 Tax=Planosporangium thailandense TaxID=765197 RepID=A0ABX0XT05_9ACTN|nr:carbohydrate ABC transporter substrate-binding protein [Planosporangium thailandense]
MPYEDSGPRGYALLPRGLAAVGAVALTLSLAACGAGASASVPFADTPQCAPYKQYQGHSGTTVTWSTGGGSDNETNGYRQAVRTFSDCTGILINYYIDPKVNSEKDLIELIDSGKASDLLGVGPGTLTDLAAAKKIKTLSAQAKANVTKGWSSDWQNYASAGGTLYGIPNDAAVKSFVWYSPSYFKEHGYQVPQTWDEMIALSDKIAATGIKPWCAGIESGAATGWPATDWMEEVMLRLEGPEIYDQWVAHKIPFNDPKVLDVANRVATILKNPAYVNGGLGDVKSVATTAFGDAGLPILAGKCALHQQASFYANMWPRGTNVSPDGDVYAFYEPPIDPAKGKPVEAGGGFVVATSTRPEVQAVQAFLSSRDFATSRVKVGGFVSANKLVDLNSYDNPIDKLSAQILRDPNAVIRFDGSDAMPAAVGNGTFWTEMTAWINGKDTKSMLDAIEASWPK